MYSKAISFVTMFSLAILFSCNGQKGGKVSLKSQADSVAYAIGVSVGGNLKKDNLDSINVEVLMNGLRAALQGDTNLAMNAQQSQAAIQNYLAEKQKQKGSVNLAAGKKFLEENKKKPGVTELPDGLQYMVISEGMGSKPVETDTVKVHYHGTLINGTVFDSSVDRGQPAEFPLGAVIKGWTEGLQLMKVGSKYRFFIPPDLAYGDRAAGQKIEANSTLIFDVELLSIKGK